MTWVPIFTRSGLLELQLLVATFILCSLIGLERQFRQKSAGYRTHVLVGLGACGFTIVSGFGFTLVLGQDVNLDPSRIAAQIVSGIGFLGAGVIFKGRDVVRGLTTAATIWMAAAVGMSCGAGMLSLALILTALHLITLFVISPLIRKVPTADRHKLLRISYLDGRGVLREILELATSMGYAATILRSRRRTIGGTAVVSIDIKFLGRQPVRDLMAPLLALEGVEETVLMDQEDPDDVEETVSRPPSASRDGAST